MRMNLHVRHSGQQICNFELQRTEAMKVHSLAPAVINLVHIHPEDYSVRL